MAHMPILERRKIEAGILKFVYDTARENYGEDAARGLIGKSVSRAAIAQGEEMADDVEGRKPDLADFLDILPLWTRDDALEIEVLDHGKDKLDFNVKRCRYAEMYKDMGLGGIGDLLSCERDGDFCIGYNPDIKLTRTQTIMKGASHCDFRYRLTKDDPEGKSR